MRAIFLAEELIRRGAFCHFVCDRPDWLFSRLPAGSFLLHRRQIDPGLRQADWLTLDVSATITRHRQLYRNLDDLISREVAFLRDVGASLVVSETAPLGLEIAGRARIPGVINANFDWHWLYKRLSGHHPELQPLALEAYEWYQKCALALRLPFAVGLEETFADLEDIPLMVGRSDRDPSLIRQELGLPRDARVLMWNIGGHPGAMPDFETLLRALPDWHLVSYAAFETKHPRFRRLDPRFNTTEIFSTLDGLIGKLGYCTCAEAHAFQVPFLFFARDGYPEDEALAEHTLRLVPSSPVVPADLESQAWVEKFQAVLSEGRSEPPRRDGASIAADFYIDLLA